MRYCRQEKDVDQLFQIGKSSDTKMVWQLFLSIDCNMSTLCLKILQTHIYLGRTNVSQV